MNCRVCRLKQSYIEARLLTRAVHIRESNCVASILFAKLSILRRSRTFQMQTLRGLLLTAAALAASDLASAQTVAPVKTRQPNIVFVQCDDLGYGDYGVFFPEPARQKSDAERAVARDAAP